MQAENVYSNTKNIWDVWSDNSSSGSDNDDGHTGDLSSSDVSFDFHSDGDSNSDDSKSDSSDIKSVGNHYKTPLASRGARMMTLMVQSDHAILLWRISEIEQAQDAIRYQSFWLTNDRHLLGLILASRWLKVSAPVCQNEESHEDV